MAAKAYYSVELIKKFLNKHGVEWDGLYHFIDKDSKPSEKKSGILKDEDLSASIDFYGVVKYNNKADYSKFTIGNTMFGFSSVARGNIEFHANIAWMKFLIEEEHKDQEEYKEFIGNYARKELEKLKQYSETLHVDDEVGQYSVYDMTKYYTEILDMVAPQK